MRPGSRKRLRPRGGALAAKPWDAGTFLTVERENREKACIFPRLALWWRRPGRKDELLRQRMEHEMENKKTFGAYILHRSSKNGQ